MSATNRKFQSAPLSRTAGNGTTATGKLKALVPALCLVLALSAPACRPEDPELAFENVSLTYTLVQGEETDVLVDKLNLGADIQGTTLRPLPVPSDLLFFEPFVLSLSTGSPAIDIYLLDAPWVKRYSATGWLAPLDVDENIIDLSPFRTELIDVTSYGSGEDRQVLAIPNETKGNILFYRKDLLEAAGFEPPATWDELFRQCETILGNGYDDTLRYGFLFHGIAIENDFYPIMWGFGGEVTDQDNRLVINSPPNVRALATIKRMLGTIAPTFEEMEKLGIMSEYKAVDESFARGEAIFMINWNIRWGDLAGGLEGQTININQIGVAPIPADAGQKSCSNIGSWAWAINGASKHPNRSRLFIQELTGYEAQVQRALERGIIPSRTDVLADPRIIEQCPEVLTIAAVFEKVHLKARPFQREINQILNNALIAALRDDLDPLEALTAAQSDIEAELSWMQRMGKGEGR